MEDPTKEEELNDWTAKQGRILTANGKATFYYSKERGYSFEPHECPHYHLISSTAGSAFLKWSKEIPTGNRKKMLICGAYSRPLFVGEWEHSTDRDEDVYNLQTNTFFIDIRIPKISKDFFENMKSLSDLSAKQLKLFARRHAFAGYSKIGLEKNRDVCVRHHCIDWNFINTPRPRPNKWFIQMSENKKVWKEYSYSRDDFHQHYYVERWKRLQRDGFGDGFVLALRKEKNSVDGRDGIICCVGDHFNYIFSRTGSDLRKKYHEEGSTVDVVDAAINRGDRDLAEAYLSIEAGHGLISNGWKIDKALQPWKEGSSFVETTSIEGSMKSSHKLFINGSRYSIYECNTSMENLNTVLNWKGPRGGKIATLLFDNFGNNKIEAINSERNPKKRKANM